MKEYQITTWLERLGCEGGVIFRDGFDGHTLESYKELLASYGEPVIKVEVREVSEWEEV